MAPKAWSWAALGGRGAVAARRARALSDEGDDPGLTDRVGPPVSKREAMVESAKQRRAKWTSGAATGVEGANQKGRRIFREDATDARLYGPAGTISACGGGAASGLAGPEAEWAARSAGPKSRKRISELKIGCLNLPRL
jgi:hypothetical protein